MQCFKAVSQLVEGITGLLRFPSIFLFYSYETCINVCMSELEDVISTLLPTVKSVTELIVLPREKSIDLDVLNNEEIITFLEFLCTK